MIYAHPHFESTLGKGRDYATALSLDHIPSKCDLVAWAFFDVHDCDQVVQTINYLKKKTQYLIIEINEFVDEYLVDLEQHLHQDWPHIQLTSTVMTNYPSRLMFSGAWCTTSANPFSYVQQSKWVQKQLKQLKPPGRTKPKMFDCLLGKKRPHRDFVAYNYQSSNLQELFIYSYFKNDFQQGIWSNLPSIDYPSTSGKAIMGKRLVPLSVLLPVDIYNETHYSIVTETTCSNFYSFFTEKIVKPIMAKRLFVVFAGKGYLSNLRRMGFRTFDAVIDENYDNIDCDYTRWEKAWRQVEWLCSQDPGVIVENIQPIVNHNYQLFRSTDWYQNVKFHINLVLG